MAKKKMYCVSMTTGIYREVLQSMSFQTEKEANAAFAFACGLDNCMPFDVELKSYVKDTKNNTTCLWDSLRFRRYFSDKHERQIFNSLCGFAMSKLHLQAKALENNEKPYGTVCDWFKDNFRNEGVSLAKQSEIAEAVCNYYGITI